MLAAGTYTVTFRSASNGFVDSLGDPLDGANNGNPAGSNYIATFVVTAPPVVVGIPAFARGPDSVDAINLPNSATDGHSAQPQRWQRRDLRHVHLAVQLGSA